MKNSITSDIIKVLSATAVALCLLFAVIRLTRGQSETGGPLRADSALDLAQLSLDKERGYLEKETKQLGSNISTEEINLRWELLKSQIKQTGMSSEEATGILSGVAKAKCPTLKASYSHPPRMWPVCAKVGWVKDKKVQIVHLTYWAPPTLVCGNSSQEEIRGMSLAYRVYVISANAPYQCWIPPLLLQSLPQEEHSAYISDDESLKQYYERQRVSN